MTANAKSRTRAAGGKNIVARRQVHFLGKDLTLTFRARGYKSSEGDGRTAADIRRELAERAGRKDT